MLGINHNWLKDNFVNPVIFDIGCADLNDTIGLRQTFPNSTIHAFECLDFFKESNERNAKTYNINYHHLAVSDIDESITFYPSLELRGEYWPWSGSICEPDKHLTQDAKWKWDKAITVPSKSLVTLCNDLNVNPDVIILDTQGAEYKILKNINLIKPSVIWAEVSEFHLYKTGVTYKKFNSMLELNGYREVFTNKSDSLYVNNLMQFTDYKKYI
jgi:FkbM family methyltransferase